MIFIGGGAGLGPLWALLQYMDAKDIDRKVTFYYGARTAKDLLPGQDAEISKANQLPARAGL